MTEMESGEPITPPGIKIEIACGNRLSEDIKIAIKTLSLPYNEQAKIKAGVLTELTAQGLEVGEITRVGPGIRIQVEAVNGDKIKFRYLPPEFDKIPSFMAERRQFCLRSGADGKQPFIKEWDSSSKRAFTSSGWSKHPECWLSLPEALAACTHDFAGVGFLCSESEPSLIGGDIDSCLNPVDGRLSRFAQEFLSIVKPFYCEVSPSGCGIRFFCLGKLPDGRSSIFGSGPQDLPEDMKAGILAAKPKLQEKIEAGEPAFNNTELYTADRHLSLTGDFLGGFEAVDRTQEITEALKLFSKRPKPKDYNEALKLGFVVTKEYGNDLVDGFIPASDGFDTQWYTADTNKGYITEIEGPKTRKKQPVYCPASGGKSKRAGYPEIDILEIAQKEGFVCTSSSSCQVLGYFPQLGSSTGRNVAIDSEKGVYCYLHNGLNAGGDGWTLLARLSGAASWEEDGKGILNNPKVKEKVMRYALEKGYIKKGEIKMRLEDALLFLAERDDGAEKKDGEGFNLEDSVFGQAMAEKVRGGEELSEDEYKEIYKMLKKYNKTQLAPNGFDLRLFPREKPKKAVVEEAKPADPTVEAAARDLLENGDLIEAVARYVGREMVDGEIYSRPVIMCAYSAYMQKKDRIHAEVTGEATSGKSDMIMRVLEAFPEKNVIIATEASKKSLYYLQDKEKGIMKDAIVYIDDAYEDHIPVRKTFTNEGNMTPMNLTVVDGEAKVLKVQDRPVMITSSVQPLVDMDRQGASRVFEVSMPSFDNEEKEKQIRKVIREKNRLSAINQNENNKERDILRRAAEILRDEGIRDVLVPFDIEEPEGTDRRSTGQFIRLIKVSAFVNQKQKWIMSMKDGRQFILADLGDVKTALSIWGDFYQTQELKVSFKAIELLKKLPVNSRSWTEKLTTYTAPEIARMYGMKQRTVEDYLKGLYDAGLVHRVQREEAGHPYGYWIDEDTKAAILDADHAENDSASRSITGRPAHAGRNCTQDFFLRAYMAKFSPDSLMDSYNNFFTNNIIIEEECIEVKNKDRALSLEEARKNISSLLLGPKFSASGQNEPLDIEKLFCVPSACSSPAPTDSESTFCVPSKQVCVQNYYVSWMQEELSNGHEHEGFNEKAAEVGLDVVLVAYAFVNGGVKLSNYGGIKLTT